MVAHCMAVNKTYMEKANAMQYIDESTNTWKSTDDFLKAVQAVYDSGQKDVLAVYCAGQGITNCYVQAEFHAQDLSRVAPFVRFLSSSSTTNNIYWGTSWPASIDADDHWLVYEGCTPVLKWSAPEGQVSAYAFDSAVSGTVPCASCPKFPDVFYHSEKIE